MRNLQVLIDSGRFLSNVKADAINDILTIRASNPFDTQWKRVRRLVDLRQPTASTVVDMMCKSTLKCTVQISGSLDAWKCVVADLSLLADAASVGLTDPWLAALANSYFSGDFPHGTLTSESRDLDQVISDFNPYSTVELPFDLLSMPFGLDDGVQLGDTFIPWGTTQEDVATFGNPNVKQKDDVCFFDWADTSFLGLAGEASTSLRSGTSLKPHQFRAHLPDFHAITFHLKGRHSRTFAGALASLRSTFAFMKSHFGPATYCYPESKSHRMLPVFYWELNDLLLSCGGHFFDTQYVSVKHYTPKHREKLATLELPRRGARLDFVKWNDLW